MESNSRLLGLDELGRRQAEALGRSKVLQHATRIVSSPLTRARDTLASMQPTDREVANLLVVSRALVDAALAREESRGTHTRLDFPETDPAFLGRLVFTDGFAHFVRLPEPAATR